MRTTAGTVLAPKRKSRKGYGETRAEPSHPPVADMVIESILALKERKGSSLAKIKRYIHYNYIVDIDRLRPYITRFIKRALQTGALVQMSGNGVNGKFRLAKVDRYGNVLVPEKKVVPRPKKKYEKSNIVTRAKALKDNERESRKQREDSHHRRHSSSRHRHHRRRHHHSPTDRGGDDIEQETVEENNSEKKILKDEKENDDAESLTDSMVQ